jgi:deazaflavin-dependent oxidoreductase (nitroreductase family)
MADTAFGKALENTREVEITTTGRKTGRQISLPVWFVLRGGQLYLLPVRGSKSDWYRNLRKTASIRLAAGQAEHTAQATPVTDPAQVETVVEAFRGKYGAHDVQAYYPDTDVAVEVPAN